MRPAVRDHKLALLLGSLARQCCKLESILGGRRECATAKPRGQTWLHYVVGCKAVSAVSPSNNPSTCCFPNVLCCRCCRAAWRGDVATLRVFLEAGGDVNLRDQKGQTLLQFAAGFGRTAAVQLLLTAGADRTADADPGHLLTHHSLQQIGLSMTSAIV